MMRLDPAEFLELDLRCHALLDDVPLHDVWAVPLHDGGPGRTLRHVHALMFGGRRPPTSLAVRALVAVRSLLGRVFRWDDERHDPVEASYLHRLTAAERAQSQVPPGTREGRFRVLYMLDDEAVIELRNATVHAFVALALVGRLQDYTVYLAIYVKPVSRFTRLYMALIDPFRRWVVYPALGRQLQRAWSRA
jgi:Protein of unknown function (DUF2867)